MPYGDKRHVLRYRLRKIKLRAAFLFRPTGKFVAVLLRSVILYDRAAFHGNRFGRAAFVEGYRNCAPAGDGENKQRNRRTTDSKIKINFLFITYCPLVCK